MVVSYFCGSEFLKYICSIKILDLHIRLVNVWSTNPPPNYFHCFVNLRNHPSLPSEKNRKRVVFFKFFSYLCGQKKASL